MRRGRSRSAAPQGHAPAPDLRPGADPYLRLAPLERALATPVGLDAGRRTAPADGSPEGARRALERVVLDAVPADGRPCYVMFSGGRDSSLVLAVATLVARRAGLPDPVPVTAVYPGVPEADESAWQHRVLEHLGVRDRVVVRLTDERAYLGDVALTALRRRGLVWPAPVQSQAALLGGLDDGAVLTGEAGDGVIAGVRGTPVHLLLARRRPSRALVRAALAALEPAASVRLRALRTADASLAPWLRPQARRALVGAMVDARGSLRWDTEKRSLLALRGTVLALHNATAGAAELGLTMHHPLGDARFVEALAREGARRGFRGRTDVFRHLGSDLLPDAVLARTTKAWFNSTRWGARERDFALAWDGAGVDPELVDPDALRREWLAERPSPASKLHVHAAWLAQAGLPLHGPFAAGARPRGSPSPHLVDPS